MINEARIGRDVIAIAASARGVKALIHLLELLPRDLTVAVCIVLHRSPLHETQLPFVLGAARA